MPLQCCGCRHFPLGTNPYGSSRQPLRSRRKLASSTVTDIRLLCCLLPVWPLISTLIRRVARRGGAGRDDPLTMPGYGIVSGQAPSMALSWLVDMRLAWGCPCHHLLCQWGPHGGKGRCGDPEGLSLPPIFLFSPIYNSCSPLAYKRESRAPH